MKTIVIISSLILTSFIPTFAELDQEANVTNLTEITDQLNTLNKKIQDSIDTNFVIISASIAIAVIAVGLSIWQGYWLKEQVILTKNDIKHRQQPWLVVKPPKVLTVLFHNGMVRYYEKWVGEGANGIPEFVTFQINVKNIGHDAARNIHHRMIMGNETFSREEFEKEGTEDRINVQPPNEEFFNTIRITFEGFNKLDQNPVFVGISVSYDWNEETKYTGAIFRIERAAVNEIDSW